MEEYKKLGIHDLDIRFQTENNSFINKYQNGLLSINNWNQLTKLLDSIFNEVKKCNDGNVADYIPQLKNVDDNLFGMTFVSVDGQVYELGDTTKYICAQSTSKPITYGIALDLLGEDNVHNFVGREPSGKNFNELCLNNEGIPHNPLINSGAIMTTSLIKNKDSLSERFDFIQKYWKDLCLDHISFNNSIYLSEKDTADRNYCLGYMMQESGAFSNGKDKNISNNINRKWELGDLQKNLELYFQLCSIESDMLGFGLLAATLANRGIHPWSCKQIFKNNTVRSILSIMNSCGMYDFSGEWNYKIGIPAKSGVSGIVYAVIPGIGSIVTYSPKLDKIGNSFRGIKFFEKLSEKLNIHSFNDPLNADYYQLSNIHIKSKKILGFLMLDGAYSNNLGLIKDCLSKGCDINYNDYDNRSALHIAVCESNQEVIDFLISHGIDQEIKDRWNKKAFDYKS